MEVSSAGGPRPPHLMEGEDEALQKFFDGQDVTEVLESSVAVDTSILEQYLSNHFDPHNFMLPESPPDSISEVCSPPRDSDLHYQRSYWSTSGENRENTFQPIASHPAPSSCRFEEPGSAPLDNCELLTQSQLQSLGLSRTCSRGDPGLRPGPSHHTTRPRPSHLTTRPRPSLHTTSHHTTSRCDPTVPQRLFHPRHHPEGPPPPPRAQDPDPPTPDTPQTPQASSRAVRGGGRVLGTAARSRSTVTVMGAGPGLRGRVICSPGTPTNQSSGIA
ncbi:unnamed protein product [Arctogadus glacialis]